MTLSKDSLAGDADIPETKAGRERSANHSDNFRTLRAWQRPGAMETVGGPRVRTVLVLVTGMRGRSLGSVGGSGPWTRRVSTVSGRPTAPRASAADHSCPRKLSLEGVTGRRGVTSSPDRRHGVPTVPARLVRQCVRGGGSTSSPTGGTDNPRGCTPTPRADKAESESPGPHSRANASGR